MVRALAEQVDHWWDWIVVIVTVPILFVISLLLAVIVLVATILRPPKRWYA